MLSKNIFKTYDIRGVVDDTLTDENVALIGQSIGSVALAQHVDRIVVGRDGRLSSERLQNALMDGLMRAGIDVIDVGMVPTPVVYFATRLLHTPSCVVVTGSHNPPQYNGLKIMLAGETLYGSAITNLYDKIVSGCLHTSSRLSVLTQKNVLPDYVRAVCADIKLARPMHVVIDCGNGVAGVVAKTVLERLGCSVTELFGEVDGRFPNHHPDPAEPHNLMDVQNTLRTSSAEIGLAFDGDADRLGVVSKDGGIIYSDRQMMLFAEDILSAAPGATIIYDAKCSAYLPRVIQQYGGIPLMWKTGHSLMKAKLKTTGAIFAGEMSGHLYFNDRWAGMDDGIYAAARLLEILSREPDEAAITERLKLLPQGICTPEITIGLSEGEAHCLIERLLTTSIFKDAMINTVDGLRADYVDGFGLVRASNTTPSLVMRFEADDATRLARIQSEFKHALQTVKPDIILPF